MTLAQELVELETRLRSAGKSVADLCREAEVARSTYDRWRRGETEPNLRTLRQVQAACSRLTDPAAPNPEAAA